MSEWLAIAAVRGSLVLAAAALVWRLLPETRPGLRRKVALAVLVGALAGCTCNKRLHDESPYSKAVTAASSSAA